jgi:hypothetical protein
MRALQRTLGNLCRGSVASEAPNSTRESVKPAMQDLAMLSFTVIFFVLAFLYVKACQKLR